MGSLLYVSRETSMFVPVREVHSLRPVSAAVEERSISRLSVAVMSQARVTDFFAQRKKCAGPTKAKLRSSRAPSVSDQDFHSSVHKEFVRVIDEAAGLEPCAAEQGSPHTPNRTSEDVQFDLGAAVFSATTNHSTAKKSRPADHKPPRRTARKRLQLPQHPAPNHKERIRSPSPQQSCQDSGKQASTAPRASGSKGLSHEELSALKARLQGIKKRAGTLSTSAPTPEPAASPQPSVKTISLTSAEATASPQPSSQDKELKKTLTRAKELAAKAQKRKVVSKDSEPAETQSDVLPAFQKYHTLAQAVPPGLSLPYPYKVLAEMFRCMDTVVAMLFNRSETPTFMKIKKGVQDMMHKRFEESHVGQILTVFPEAYTLRQENNIPTFNNSVRKGSYQLTVEPVIRDDCGSRPTLTSTRLLERRHIFHHNLVSLVKQHHKAFLSSLDPPLSVPEDKLSRWHPRFNVDTVPPVADSALPLPPQTERLTTAQEVLDKARALMTPKMERALVSVALKSAEKTVEDKAAPVPVCPASTQTPATLKGVSQSLLERIRAKEAQKLQAAMTRNPEQDERLLMMSRLGELARILRNVFVAEKKPALIMEAACNRMVASYTSALSTGEMEKHIRLLAEVASDWLTIVSIRKDFYLKLNKSMELSVVQDKLRMRLKEEERL